MLLEDCQVILPPEFLLTHPLSSSRISDAFNAAENISSEGKKETHLNFH